MLEPAVADWRDIRAIAAGCAHLVGLEFGGRVVAAGEDARGQCGVSGWRQIVAVSCGDACTVGLCADGTAVAAGQVYVGFVSPDNPDGWVGCAVGGWSHLLAVCCGHNHIAAMTDSGQILTCGQDADGQCRGAVSFAAFRDLRQYDGYTIFDNAAGEESRNSGTPSRPNAVAPIRGRRAFSEAYGWFSYASFLRDQAERLASCLQTDATALTLLTPEGTFRWLYDARRLVREENGVIRRAESGENDLVLLSLSANGRLTATGDNQEGQCDTEDWAQIVAASTSGTHTVGLRADGHVLATGRNASGECDVGGWRRVLQVVALPDVTLGLCADGRILHTGKRGRILDALRGVRAMTGAKNRVVFVLSDGSLRVHLRGRRIFSGGSRRCSSVPRRGRAQSVDPVESENGSGGGRPSGAPSAWMRYRACRARSAARTGQRCRSKRFRAVRRYPPSERDGCFLRTESYRRSDKRCGLCRRLEPRRAMLLCRPQRGAHERAGRAATDGRGVLSCSRLRVLTYGRPAGRRARVCNRCIAGRSVRHCGVA